jgi:transcriptional regulator with XRE-family HTH domain
MPLESQRAKPLSFYVKVGRRMKELRVERGLTLVELGRQIGVSFQQIQKYERGWNRIDIEKLLRIAAILKVEPNTFWEDAEDNTSRPAPRSSDRATVILVKTYNRISNPQIRRKLLDLVRMIAAVDSLFKKK